MCGIPGGERRKCEARRRSGFESLKHRRYFFFDERGECVRAERGTMTAGIVLGQWGGAFCVFPWAVISFWGVCFNSLVADRRLPRCPHPQPRSSQVKLIQICDHCLVLLWQRRGAERVREEKNVRVRHEEHCRERDAALVIRKRVLPWNIYLRIQRP